MSNFSAISCRDDFNEMMMMMSALY
jgi:hypothetical protein